METLLYQYNPWWEEKFELKSIYLRNNYLNKLKQYLDNRLIVFLTGLRRVGKTTLMKLIIYKLIF